jgi:hypothetical protein
LLLLREQNMSDRLQPLAAAPFFAATWKSWERVSLTEADGEDLSLDKDDPYKSVLAYKKGELAQLEKVCRCLGAARLSCPDGKQILTRCYAIPILRDLAAANLDHLASYDKLAHSAGKMPPFKVSNLAEGKKQAKKKEKADADAAEKAAKKKAADAAKQAACNDKNDDKADTTRLGPENAGAQNDADGQNARARKDANGLNAGALADANGLHAGARKDANGRNLQNLWNNWRCPWWR